MDTRPILGISMGDPFGNGPEITVQALSSPALYRRCRPLVVGDWSSMAYAIKVARQIHGCILSLHRVTCVDEALFQPGTIDLLDLGLVPEQAIPNNSQGGPAAALSCGRQQTGRRSSIPICKKSN